MARPATLTPSDRRGHRGTPSTPWGRDGRRGRDRGSSDDRGDVGATGGVWGISSQLAIITGSTVAPILGKTLSPPRCRERVRPVVINGRQQVGWRRPRPTCAQGSTLLASSAPWISKSAVYGSRIALSKRSTHRLLVSTLSGAQYAFNRRHRRRSTARRSAWILHTAVALIRRQGGDSGDRFDRRRARRGRATLDRATPYERCPADRLLPAHRGWW